MANILILEDNLSLSFSWRELFESVGHRVDCQDSADIPLNQLRTSNFDLVIVDMFFQQSDGLTLQGLEFLETLENLPQSSRPKVLAVSGQNISEGSILEVAQVMGVDSTLQKPIQPKQLLETVNQLLSHVKS